MEFCVHVGEADQRDGCTEAEHAAEQDQQGCDEVE